jgi:glycosyltransferase involved in cell wall biosynthesis
MDGMTTPAAASPTEARRPAGYPSPPVSTVESLPVIPPDLDIVVPVHNEAGVLEASIHKLHAFVDRECDFSFRITIADNASTDETLAIARRLSGELPGVVALHFDRKGRGLALRAAWGRSDATVVAYTDVDLSTDLSALPALVGPLLDGEGDLAIGSRLAEGAQVTRSVKREVISRTYNILLRVLLDVGFSDAQCGFKAGRGDVVRELLPAVENDRWFFDTELLYVAQRRRFSIREIPVRWVEDPDSRVAIAATVREDLEGIARLRRGRSHRRPTGDRPGRRHRQVLHVGRQSS